MAFAHVDHAEESCLTCHHNIVDETGVGNCMVCHVRRGDLAPRLESQFHGLCRECHVERQLQGRSSGPTRRCLACHHAEDEP